MLNASVDMLNHLGHKQHADLIYNAMVKTVAEDNLFTPGILFGVIFIGKHLI